MDIGEDYPAEDGGEMGVPSFGGCNDGGGT